MFFLQDKWLLILYIPGQWLKEKKKNLPNCSLPFKGNIFERKKKRRENVGIQVRIQSFTVQSLCEAF
jgi:hypothetical protein